MQEIYGVVSESRWGFLKAFEIPTSNPQTAMAHAAQGEFLIEGE
jgi:hypothetical protein